MTEEKLKSHVSFLIDQWLADPETETNELYDSGNQSIKNLENKVNDFIVKNCIPKPKGIKERIIFFFKYTAKGAIVYLPWYLFHALLLWVGFQLVYPIPYFKVLGIFIILRMIKVGIIELRTDKHHPKDEL